MKAILKYSWLLGLGLLLSNANAQEERTKSFNESWDGITRINVKHRHGTLEVIPHNEPGVRLDAQVMVRAKDAADAQIMIDHLDIHSNKFSDELEIETEFNTKSWISSGNTTKVKFEDGAKVSGILDYDVKYKLYVPALNRLELSNRYYDIDIAGDIKVDELYIKQYDANVRVRNVDGEFNMQLKYSDARIGSVGEAMLDLYDSEVEIDGMEKTYIKSKYSELKVGKTGPLEIDSYDDEYEIGSVDGDLQIEDKYSEFEIESTHDVKISIYDSELQLNKAGAIAGRSKYSDITLGEVNGLDLESSYDDNYNIRSLGTFSCYESKYSEYEIQALGTSAKLKSYDDEFIVGGLSSQFTEFDIDCKYTTVKLPVYKLPGYNLNANSKYGSLKYDDPSDSELLKIDNDVLEVKARVGSQSKTNIFIKAYDSDIRLN